MVVRRPALGDRDESKLEWSYLGEDYAFCERARQAGIPIIVDTRIRLFHLGDYPFGWEEIAGRKTERVAGLTIDLAPAPFPTTDNGQRTTEPATERSGQCPTSNAAS
jgi:hypothetical protein